ncbi:MAG: hypothetical protein IT580_09095 [Verrucomicrobiales bacterium]|nr:hypothetical protein [Verrucomicrobiales bacterium]
MTEFESHAHPVSPGQLTSEFRARLAEQLGRAPTVEELGLVAAVGQRGSDSAEMPSLGSGFGRGSDWGIFCVAPLVGKSPPATETSAGEKGEKGECATGTAYATEPTTLVLWQLMAAGVGVAWEVLGVEGSSWAARTLAVRLGSGIELETSSILPDGGQRRLLVVARGENRDAVRRAAESHGLVALVAGTLNETGSLLVRKDGLEILNLRLEWLSVSNTRTRERERAEGGDGSSVPAAIPSPDAREAVAANLEQGEAGGSDLTEALTLCLARWAASVPLDPPESRSLRAVSEEASASDSGASGSVAGSGVGPREPGIAEGLAPNRGGSVLRAVAAKPREDRGPRGSGVGSVVHAVLTLACAGATVSGAVLISRESRAFGAGDTSDQRERRAGQWLACQALRVPVLGELPGLGDVEWLGGGIESEEGPVLDLVVLGTVDEERNVAWGVPADDGDAVLWLGEGPELPRLGRSDLERWSEEQFGFARTLRTALVGLIRAGGVKQVFPVGAEGLAAALVACGGLRRDDQGVLIKRGVVAELAEGSIPAGMPVRELWFGEAPTGVVMVCAATDAACLVERARLLGVSATRLGTLGGDHVTLRWPQGEVAVAVTVAAARVESGPAAPSPV